MSGSMVIRTSDVYQDSEQHRCGHNQGYLRPESNDIISSDGSH